VTNLEACVSFGLADGAEGISRAVIIIHD